MIRATNIHSPHASPAIATLNSVPAPLPYRFRALTSAREGECYPGRARFAVE